MKKIVFWGVIFTSFFIISCNDDHIEPQMPDTEILSVSISDNSVSIAWKDVSTDSEPCYYSVNLLKPKHQNWWNNNAEYYQLDDNLLYVEGERWDKYPYEYVEVNYIESTDKTSATFNNLEKSTVYLMWVMTHGNGMSGGSGALFFRTKEE